MRGSLRETVDSFQWLKQNQLLIKPAQISEGRDFPVWYGELFTATADGKNFKALYGYRAGGDQAGSHIKKAAPIRGTGHLISDLPDNEDWVLIESHPWALSDSAHPSVLKVNLKNGVSKRVMGSPIGNASFIASPKGQVHFATATDKDDIERVFQYVSDNDSWTEIAANTAKKGSMDPIEVSADGQSAYFLADTDKGTTGLYLYHFASKQRQAIYEHESESVGSVEFDESTGEALWVVHGSDNSVHYLANEHGIVRARKMLNKAFSDQKLLLDFTSITRDQKKAVFFVSSDRDPGAWYSVDLDKRKANLELEKNPLIDPEQMVAMKPIQMKARDGLTLNGFYTAAKRSTEAGKAPMVVLVHGGPHYVQDEWSFDPEVQTLATRGYAVLQINFRGSSGFGREFEIAGRGEWGRKMQDDVTDATRWPIEQGLVDPKRICIMGGSYGGYATLMGLIREPDLYRCGIDLYGVTDLEEKYKNSDVADKLFGEAFLRSTIGSDKKEWDARSPSKLVDKIQVPVLLIHGGKDKRVPIKHSELMEKALKKAGKPVETLYFPNEQHGFYNLDNNIAAYEKVLSFLQANIGLGTD